MAHHMTRRLAEWGEQHFGGSVHASGWVEDIRHVGSIAFLQLRLRDGILQVTAKRKEGEALFEQIVNLPRESVVVVEGQLVRNAEARAGFELHPTALQVLSAAEAPLPLGVIDKVTAEMETRLDNRFLDLRKPAVRVVVEVRSLLLQGLRTAMAHEGFVEVATPKVVKAGAEGGATLFPVQYFGTNAYLAQSPQLYKQMLMASGLDRVYEIAPAFRAELSDTTRHTAEFSSFDAELAFIESQEDVLRVLETVVVNALGYVKLRGGPWLEALGVDLRVPKLPAPRVTYDESLEMLRGGGKRIREGEDIDTEGEKLLGKLMAEQGHDLFYITEYPSAIKPFYIMAKDDEPDRSTSFDLEYKGDEMASGGQREHRSDRLVARMREKGLDPAGFDAYLRAFRYGMPPHGGWGLGVDRLVQKALDLPNIREVILFPRDRNRLTP